jgi:Abortive infection C-terminus
MDDLLSPRYKMKLAQEVYEAISNTYPDVKNIRRYIEKWYREESPFDINDRGENFRIISQKSGEIDLLETLHTMKGEDLLRVAIDIGVDTPGFLPAYPTFKNELKTDYKTAYDAFMTASRLVHEDPGSAIIHANSAIESILKEILKDERFTSLSSGATGVALASAVSTEFNRLDSTHPEEIKRITRSLVDVTKAIGDIRSQKTHAHGKTSGDYIVTDSIYSQFIVNSVTTVGIYLISYYKDSLPKPLPVENEYDSNSEDLPF